MVSGPTDRCTIEHFPSRQTYHSLHNVILFWVVRVFLAGNFEHSGNSTSVIFKNVPNIVGNMLIDKDDPNIVAGGKFLKGFLDLGQLGVLLDNQKVGSLGITVPHASEKKPRDSVLVGKKGRKQLGVRDRR